MPRQAVDPLDDASVSADYRRGIVRAMVVRALEQAYPGHANERRHRPDKWIGQSVERLEDPPLVTGRGRFAGDINFPHQLHMRIVRSNHAHGKITVDLHRRRRGAAGRGRGVDRGRHRRRAADRFPRGPIEKLAPYRQPVLATRQGALRRRAGRGGVRRGPVRRRGRRRSRHHGRRGTAGAARRRAPSRGEFSFGRNTEAAVLHQGYGDVDAVFKARAARGRAEAHRRPALRRAAGDARRASAATTRPRHAGTARRRQGAAPQQGAAGAHAQPAAVVGAVLRVARRRRLRHPRRDLSRGRAGLRRRDAASTAR